jgi:hypothetical protein
MTSAGGCRAAVPFAQKVSIETIVPFEFNHFHVPPAACHQREAYVSEGVSIRKLGISVRDELSAASGAALYVDEVQSRAQAFSKRARVGIGPEMHEEQVRRVIDHVAVQGGHLDATGP